MNYFAPGLLAGEVAVITGGSSGIGLEIARAFSQLEAAVVIVSRSEEQLAAASNFLTSVGLECSTVPCDVRDDSAVDEVHAVVSDRYGGATILVNNAAANFAMSAERMTRRAFETVVDIDLVGTFNVTRQLIGDMIQTGRGSILNMVVPDAERGFPGYAHSGAAKAGIISLTRSWAREWGKYGIRVNALGPGPVPTQGAASHMFGLSSERKEAAFEDIAGSLCIERLGTVTDIANAAVFLSSEAASWITGVSLSVDGGLNVA